MPTTMGEFPCQTLKTGDDVEILHLCPAYGPIVILLIVSMLEVDTKMKFFQLLFCVAGCCLFGRCVAALANPITRPMTFNEYRHAVNQVDYAKHELSLQSSKNSAASLVSTYWICAAKKHTKKAI